MLGSLLGSVSSGVLGLFGQSSANDAAQEAAKHQYRWGVQDMMKAGLNPAAMYSGGNFSGAPVTPQGNVMGSMSAALKDAASSAVQVKVANTTIDKMADEMAKLKAERALTEATTPGVRARADIDVQRTDAIRRIPEVVRTPIYQFGFGGREAATGGSAASIAGGVTASGSPIVKKAFPDVPGVSSAKDALRELKRKYDALPSLTEAEKEAARLRNAKRWGWLTGNSARGSVQYQQ